VTTKPTAAAAATVVDFLEKPLDVLYIRRRNGYCELTLEIENRNDIHALNASGYSRCILGVRNNVARMHGQITEHAETARGVTITAKDPYYNMSWRRFWAGPPTGFTYTSLGDGEIAMRLIEKTDADENCFLKRGTIQSGANRTRHFEVGDRVSEKVEYMAALAGGFAFTIDATFGTVGELAKFNAHSPYDVLMPMARFEFGQDTLNNVVDYKRIMLPLVNRVNVVGRHGGTAYAEWVAGRNAYGLWEDERGQVDVDETNASNITTLDDIAASYTMHELRYGLDLTPGPDAPQLFTDFDVINTVPVLIKNFGIERSMTRSVREVAIRLDPASGVENIETLTLDDPV
jgi:hypothetical protein